MAALVVAGAALLLASVPSVRVESTRAVSSLLTRFRFRSLGKASPDVSSAEQATARELYLKGRYEWSHRTPDSLNRALDLFTQAIVHDPGYARSYAGLADTYDLLQEYSTMPEGDAYPRAIAAAKKAIELDDSLAEGHRALAFAEFYGEWKFADAEKEFRRAIELNPNDPEARKWYANAFAVPGRYEESLAQISRAQELDPASNSILADKRLMLYLSGKTRDGTELLKEVERLAPGFLSPHIYLMTIGFESRDFAEYLSEGEKAAEASNDPVLKDVIAAARSGYERGGVQELLRCQFAKQLEYYTAGKLWATKLAMTSIAMGKRRKALELLDQGFNRREMFLLTCLTYPDLLTLKNEPEYKALLKKINFPISPDDATRRLTASLKN